MRGKFIMSDKKKQIDFVLKNIIKALDEERIEHSNDEENINISCMTHKFGLHIDFMFKINAENMSVMLISELPCIVKRSRTEDLAAAVCFINNFTANGCFDFDIDNGKIFFRMTNCFCDSLIGKEAYDYMINCLLSMLDEYSEQFKLLAEGSISLDEFVDRNGI